MKSLERLAYLTIVFRLLPGSYSLMTGHPSAVDSVREFYDDVLQRIPEFKDEKDIAEEAVMGAVEYAINNLCKPIETHEETPDSNYYRFIGVYECYHPDIGFFYINIEEEEEGDSGYGYWSVSLSKNKEEAIELYRETPHEEE